MIDKPLPPSVFGEEPKYVAIRLDQPGMQAPLASAGLAMLHGLPSLWTYLPIAEAIERINRDGVTITPTPTPAQQLADVQAKLDALRTAVNTAVYQLCAAEDAAAD